MRHYYDRKEDRKPPGSHRIGIVCRKPCKKHFMLSDWGEARRHYYEPNTAGQLAHPGAPFDHTQFKTMGKTKARERASRVRGKRTPFDHPSDSESDVENGDYASFNSVPGRPGYIPEKYISPRQKKGAKDKPADGDEGTADGDVENAADGVTEKAADGENAMGKEEAAEPGDGEGQASEPNDCANRCTTLQNDLEEIQGEIASLLAIIEVDRAQRSQDIADLAYEGFLIEERAAGMINDNPSIQEDNRFHHLRWTAAVAAQVAARAQEQTDGFDEAQRAYVAFFPDPVRSSSNGGLDMQGLAIEQPLPPPSGEELSEIDPSLIQYTEVGTQPYTGRNTAQALGIGGDARYTIEELQDAVRTHHYELSRDNAIEILDQLAWDQERVAQLIHHAREGSWVPPVGMMTQREW